MNPISTQALSTDRPDHSRDTLHLLVQSPFVLFVYWQLSASKRAMVQEHFDVDWPALQPTLRIYDISGLSFDGSSANEVSELPLPEGESCFLSGFRPGASYVADLGVKGDHGHFMPLLRSNTVQTPPADALHAQPFALVSQPVIFRLIKPIHYDHFSAYSVYLLGPAAQEPGGDAK